MVLWKDIICHCWHPAKPDCSVISSLLSWFGQQGASCVLPKGVVWGKQGGLRQGANGNVGAVGCTVNGTGWLRSAITVKPSGKALEPV